MTPFFISLVCTHNNTITSRVCVKNTYNYKKISNACRRRAASDYWQKNRDRDCTDASLSSRYYIVYSYNNNNNIHKAQQVRAGRLLLLGIGYLSREPPSADRELTILSLKLVCYEPIYYYYYYRAVVVWCEKKITVIKYRWLGIIQVGVRATCIIRVQEKNTTTKGRRTSKTEANSARTVKPRADRKTDMVRQIFGTRLVTRTKQLKYNIRNNIIII